MTISIHTLKHKKNKAMFHMFHNNVSLVSYRCFMYIAHAWMNDAYAHVMQVQWCKHNTTTNFWPLCHAFLLQQQDLVAIGGVLATICTFGCDRWNFCHANCFMAPSTKIIVISKCYHNHLENGCNKLSLLPRFKLCCE
jgi:hypothetical protein